MNTVYGGGDPERGFHTALAHPRMITYIDPGHAPDARPRVLTYIPPCHTDGATTRTVKHPATREVMSIAYNPATRQYLDTASQRWLAAPGWMRAQLG